MRVAATVLLLAAHGFSAYFYVGGLRSVKMPLNTMLRLYILDLRTERFTRAELADRLEQLIAGERRSAYAYFQYELSVRRLAALSSLFFGGAFFVLARRMHPEKPPVLESTPVAARLDGDNSACLSCGTILQAEDTKCPQCEWTWSAGQTDA